MKTLKTLTLKEVKNTIKLCREVGITSLDVFVPDIHELQEARKEVTK